MKSIVSATGAALIVIGLISLSNYQRPATGVPLPQAEQQRIHNLAVLCTEAVSENYYYGNFTTVTDESILAQCDDIFVDMKNQCDVIGLVMEQCSDPAYDRYILDRGLSSRIEPEQSDSTPTPVPSLGLPLAGENDQGNEDEDDQSTDEEDNNDDENEEN